MRARAGTRVRRRAARAAVVAACLLPASALATPAATAPATLGAPAARANGLATLAAPPGADPAALDRTVRFLQEMQNADGGFGGVRGAASDPGISAWAALALAANGINPFDQAKPGGTDAATYVLRTTRFRVTTDYERVALMAIAAGIPLRDFSGTDLVAGIMRARLPSGAFAHGDAQPGAEGGINDTAFAIFALGGVQEPAVQAAVRDAADWLLSVQNADGGWEFTTGDARSSADITGAVIQALRYAGRAGTQAEQRALGFLRTMQQDDGGFQYSEAVCRLQHRLDGVGRPRPVGGGHRPGELGEERPRSARLSARDAAGRRRDPLEGGSRGRHQLDLDDRLRRPGLRGHDLAAGVRPSSGQAGPHPSGRPAVRRRTPRRHRPRRRRARDRRRRRQRRAALQSPAAAEPRLDPRRCPPHPHSSRGEARTRARSPAGDDATPGVDEPAHGAALAKPAQGAHAGPARHRWRRRPGGRPGQPRRANRPRAGDGPHWDRWPGAGAVGRLGRPRHHAGPRTGHVCRCSRRRRGRPRDGEHGGRRADPRTRGRGPAPGSVPARARSSRPHPAFAPPGPATAPAAPSRSGSVAASS